MPDAYQSHRLRDFEPDRLRHALHGGEAEHILLQPGAAGARLRKWQGEDLTVDRGEYGFDVLARGAFRPGFVTIAFSRGAAIRQANGFAVRNEQVQLYPEGSEILYRAGAGTTWTAIQVRREELQRRAGLQGGRELLLPQRHALNLPAPEDLPELARVVESLLDDLEAAPDAGMEKLRDALVDSVVDALGALSHPPDAERRALHAHVRTQTVLEAQRLLRARLDEPYDSARLCRALDYPERTVELYFRQTLQISPQAWHRKARLHRARRLLMEAGAGAGGRSVSDVALLCGFDQLGRFSVEYRRLFGEKPSETFRRPAAGIVVPAASR
ncbi:MAG TPA: helix-turn-helix domain-containing protein [Planctomycetota bacterium]